MIGRNNSPETNAMKKAECTSPLMSWLCAGLLSCLLLLSLNSFAFAEDYTLYLPNPLKTAMPPLPENGVLVKKITIQKGDTLSELSRQFSGNGTYFPQILLFNEIRNPNLIYAGKELLVPLTAAKAPRSVASLTSIAPVMPHTRPAAFHRKKDLPTNNITTSASASAGERNLYEQSAVLFAEGKHQEALDGFNRFLKEYPSSPLAPDASLYRGDCYLRLSGN